MHHDHLHRALADAPAARQSAAPTWRRPATRPGPRPCRMCCKPSLRWPRSGSTLIDREAECRARRRAHRPDLRERRPMSAPAPSSRRLGLAAAAIAVLVSGSVGYGVAHLRDVPSLRRRDGRRARQRQARSTGTTRWSRTSTSIKPGKSPFMDMQLVPATPTTAPPATRSPGVHIDPPRPRAWACGWRRCERGAFAQRLDATGVIDFNQREVAIVQARAAGFVSAGLCQGARRCGRARGRRSSTCSFRAGAAPRPNISPFAAPATPP